MFKEFDYYKLINRKWDKEILNYVGLIHEYKGRQELYLTKNEDDLDVLVEIAKRQSTESSNEIEGIRTTNQRLIQILNEKVSPKTREEEEIKGYKYALNLIHENYKYIPIKPNTILQLHKTMYQFMDTSIGGHFKDSTNEIDMIYPGGSKEVIFKPLDPLETPNALEKLCEEYNKAINQYNIDTLLIIPIFIHDFLCIHPFNDGNGRISRLLTNLLLYQSGYLIGKYISIEKIIQNTKEDYYQSLYNSSKDWSINNNDDTPFIKYMLSVILASYRDFEDRINIIGNKLSAIEIVQKAVKSKIGKFTKNDILELCPEIKRSSVESSLKKLCDKNIIKKVGNGKSTFYYNI